MSRRREDHAGVGMSVWSSLGMVLPRLARDLARLARYGLLVLLCGVAVAALWSESLPPNSLARVDLQQDYVSAKALLNAGDPYARLGTLFDTYLPDSSAPRVEHPNPHPAAAILLAIPYSYLPYPLLSPLWTVAMTALLVVWIARSLHLGPAASLALVAWPPALWVLGLGQIELLLLGCLILGWQAAGKGQDRLAGLWLGLAAALKLYPILFLVPFVARRRPRILLSAGIVILACQGLGLLVLGWDTTWRYWTVIAPSTLGVYAGSDLDGSLRAAVARALPLDVANYAWLLGMAFGLASLALLPARFGAFALFLVLPSVWGYYAVLTLPGLSSLWRESNRKLLVALGFVLVSLVRPVFVLLGIETAGLVLLGLQPVGYVLLLVLAWQSQVAVSKGGSRLARLLNLSRNSVSDQERGFLVASRDSDPIAHP